jgi:hypothetical protein
MEGYKFSELLNLVIKIKLHDIAYRNKRGKCQCSFKSKGKEWIVKWTELNSLLERASTKSDMSRK